MKLSSSNSSLKENELSIPGSSSPHGTQPRGCCWHQCQAAWQSDLPSDTTPGPWLGAG